MDYPIIERMEQMAGALCLGCDGLFHVLHGLDVYTDVQGSLAPLAGVAISLGLQTDLTGHGGAPSI